VTEANVHICITNLVYTLESGNDNIWLLSVMIDLKEGNLRTNNSVISIDYLLCKTLDSPVFVLQPVVVVGSLLWW